MSASCEMTINFYGSDAEFNNLLNKLYELEGCVKKEFLNNPYWPFIINGHQITATNGGCHNIWGVYYLYPEADLYLELAKAVPNAAFDISSYRINEVGGGGCETFLYAKYENHTLTLRTQCGVDSMSFMFLLAEMYPDCYSEETKFAIAGKTKLFNVVDDLKEYIEDWGGFVCDMVTSETDYLICNNPHSNSKKIQKAKELNIPIISEAKFVRMFADVFDFEDNTDVLFEDFTYEEFCQQFAVDETITEKVFQELIQSPLDDGVVLYGDNEVSKDGPFEKFVYVLGDDGDFIKMQ